MISFPAEIEPRFHHVHHGDGRPGQPGEFQRGQANGAGSDDQHVLAFLRIAAVGRVAADAQRFHQGELLVGEFFGRVQLVGANQKPFAQTAVDHHADDIELFAAVAVALPAGVALAAVHVRFDATAVAGLDVGHAVADFEDFHAQLVAGDSRIAEERHLAQVAAVIGAADAHAMRPHQGLPRSGRLRFGDVHVLEMFRLF